MDPPPPQLLRFLSLSNLHWLLEVGRIWRRQSVGAFQGILTECSLKSYFFLFLEAVQLRIEIREFRV